MFGDVGEGEVFGEVLADVGGGVFDLGREGVGEGGGEVGGVVAELLGEEGEEGDHAGVAFGLDGFGLEVGFFEGVDLCLGESGDVELGGDLLEVIFAGGGLKNLSGFEEAEDFFLEGDGDGGGTESGEAVAGHGAVDFGGAGELVVGVAAGVAGGGAEVEKFAEVALIVLVLVEAPLVIDGKDAQGEAGGFAEGVLVIREELRVAELVEEFVLECCAVCHGAVAENVTGGD